MEKKILIHIIAISLFLFGAVINHVVLNSYLMEFTFFTVKLSRIFIVDTSLLLIGIAFFIEFSLTFKPIQIIDKTSDREE